MASGSKFLAFDLGASSGRAVMGLLNDGHLSLAEVHRFGNEGISVGDSLYWDALRLFDEMKEGLRLAVQVHGKEIAGIGLDAWGVDFALLGPNDVLLENPHCYRDPRTDGMLREAQKSISLDEIYAETGIQIMPINTLYQLLSVQHTNPWMLDMARTLLMIPDLFNFWFTGIKANEFTEATTSQMYNPLAGTWAKSLLEKFEIPTHFLGEIVPPGTVLGKLRPSVAQEVGAPEIRFVAPATHDTGSAVAAVPATGHCHAYLSSGTWSLMGVESKQPIINDTARALNFTNEGGVANTFRVLKNIMGLWLIQECRRVWAQEGMEYTFEELTDLAATAEPFRSLVDPDDATFLKPGDMPARIREYCRRTSQPVPEDEAGVVRAALDSLALKYRSVFQGLEALIGRRLEPIHIVGGGTQNRLLCQLTANTTGRPVIAGPVEATAIGNILMQAIGLGHISSIEEGRGIVRKSFDVVTYDPQPDSRVEEAYARFQALLG